MDSDYIELIIKGSIIGQLVADAVAYPYQGQTGPIHRIKGTPPLNYTGKGALLIATVAAIAENKTFDTEDLLQMFHNVYIGSKFCPEEECEDIDLATIQAIKNHGNGMPPDKCGIRDLMYNDADCMTRILPIALFYSTSDLSTFVNNIHAACSISHSHPRSHVVCDIYGLMVRNLFLQASEKVINVLDEYYKSKSMFDHVKELEIVRDAKDKELRPFAKLEDCLWLSWDAYSTNNEDYMGCVVKAISHGGSTNINASLAGALCGLTNGLNAIPQKWLDTIVLPDDTMIAVDDFVQLMISLR
jgi:ADP-ribosyl-[dinitrogen reductase] hydrolase